MLGAEAGAPAAAPHPTLSPQERGEGKVVHATRPPTNVIPAEAGTQSCLSEWNAGDVLNHAASAGGQL